MQSAMRPKQPSPSWLANPAYGGIDPERAMKRDEQERFRRSEGPMNTAA
jgi:hypothetical protein